MTFGTKRRFPDSASLMLIVKNAVIRIRHWRVDSVACSRLAGAMGIAQVVLAKYRLCFLVAYVIKQRGILQAVLKSVEV